MIWGIEVGEEKKYEQYPLLENTAKNRELFLKEDTCDKYDYLTAAGCGVIGGFIDIFFVGQPGASKLGQWSDSQVDNTVMAFAKGTGWNPGEGKQDNVKSAIGFLERKFPVNYDQKNGMEVGQLFRMSPKNHHMMSLAHSPDIVGLFFSVLNQFTGTSSFISKGQLLTINAGTAELQGGNFIAKIFCGVVNWVGHIMSDMAGSSGAQGRGTGIVLPFYELFGLCSFGQFKVQNGASGQYVKNDLATLATKAFQEGYDLRFGMAQAVPVVITELLIRLIWAVRRRFQYNYPIRECLPTQKHADLRVMLITGNGVLCLLDGIDAGIRSGGNSLAFFMRLNLVAWFRFITLVLKEVFVRIGISDSVQKQINSYKRINMALQEYLEKLKQIDINKFKEETERSVLFAERLNDITCQRDLNRYLTEYIESEGLSKPWEGDFDDFMSDRNNRLVFK